MRTTADRHLRKPFLCSFVEKIRRVWARFPGSKPRVILTWLGSAETDPNGAPAETVSMNSHRNKYSLILAIVLAAGATLCLGDVTRASDDPASSPAPAPKTSSARRSASIKELPAQKPTYKQQQDVVYGEADGVGLPMDIFTPLGKRNGLAVIDVVSGAWYTDRGKIRDHQRGQFFQIFCGRGYTVFAIRPGSRSRFSAPEMVQNLRKGIHWVRDHAAEYGIDPDHMGICGASAGGHLACLAMVTPDVGKDKKVIQPFSAAIIFFPPTDFLEWGGYPIDFSKNNEWGGLVRGLALSRSERQKELTKKELTEHVRQISPARLVKSKQPPFLIIHGDADPLVPLQQSQVFVDALKAAGGDAQLIVKHGGTHPWPTINEEVAVMADWLDKRLPAASTPQLKPDDPAPVTGRDVPYVQHQDVVYGEADGSVLVMDVFTPIGPKNGLGIIDVASGSWHSDRGKIRDHMRAQVYDIYCGHGYTVFGMRPGSISKFSIPEMVKHLRVGTRWVRAHAAEYGIDPNNLGITGGSAGGHLAALTVVSTPLDKNGKLDQPFKAVGIFFPPTDFLHYRGDTADFGKDDRSVRRVRELFGDLTDASLKTNPAALTEMARQISPALLVERKQPPFLIIHGDADPIVPLHQSELLVEALEKAGGDAKLIVKPGGAHPWPTIHEEVKVMADWFDKQLKPHGSQ
jgi:acetyl esterase/lipase